MPVPNVPNDPPLRVKTEPPETVTSPPLVMFNVLLLVSENKLPLTFKKLPPATLKSEPLATVSVLALRRTRASAGTLTFIWAFLTRWI